MYEISVIMSIYKEKEHILKRSIESILNQSFRNFEFIIVIDNPDNKEAIALIKKYATQDSRIKLHINVCNKGIGASLNKGINLSRGKYIARQDADDESLPERFEKQIKIFRENPDIDVVGTGLEYIDENGHTILERYYKEKVMNQIKRYSPMAHPTVLNKKEIFEKYGNYNEYNNIKGVEDYDLWCIWYLKGVKFYNIKEILYKYYQSSDNVKNKHTKLQLWNTIKTKFKYCLQLHYGIIDYLYLFCEICVLLLLPDKLITGLFYIITRECSKFQMKIHMQKHQ